jgi:hypothetical protein
MKPIIVKSGELISWELLSGFLEGIDAYGFKGVLLSFERIPVLNSHQGGRGRLSKERNVVRPEIQ